MPAAGAVLMGSFDLPPDPRFPWHHHRVHPLAWASARVLVVVIPGGTWVLPTIRALWLPAGISHGPGRGGRAARPVLQGMTRRSRRSVKMSKNMRSVETNRWNPARRALPPSANTS